MLTRLLVAVIALTLLPQTARADELARTFFDLGVAQGGDALTTSGPRIGVVFPGGFVAQDQTGHCVGPNVAPVAGGKCFAFEIDTGAVRAGCVNNVYRDVGCATFINFGVNAVERMVSHWFKDSEKARHREAVLNRIFSVAYAGVIWPNNARVDAAISKRGNVFAGTAPRTVTVWQQRF